MDWQQILTNFVNWCATEGVKIIIAFVILIFSFIVISALVKGLKKRFLKKNVDKTIGRTICKIINYGLKILVVLALFGYLGIDTSGVAALITTIGVGVGLALQGSLSNVAGGVLIILLRPFKLDDYIEAQGEEGIVEDINLIYTYIKTYDNKVIALPNGNLANNVIVNHYRKDTRRVDAEFRISLSADFKRVEEIVLETLLAEPKVLKDPAPMCRVSGHDASSLTLATKAWCKSEDYWDVYFAVYEKVKLAFDKNGIEIPNTQLVVKVKNDK